MKTPAPHDAAAGAKLLVLVIGLGWGFNWVAARIILSALPPWTMRTVGIGLGASTLFVIAPIARVRHARALGRAAEDRHRRLHQCRHLQRLLRLCAGLRHDLPRHRHRLFHADLVGAAWRAWCSRNASMRSSLWPSCSCTAGLTILILPLARSRPAPRRPVRADLRLDLGDRHHLCEMGAIARAGAGGRRMAIAVRLADADGRHAVVRGRAA